MKNYSTENVPTKSLDNSDLIDICIKYSYETLK